jgi:hypothetical protein
VTCRASPEITNDVTSWRSRIVAPGSAHTRRRMAHSTAVGWPTPAVTRWPGGPASQPGSAPAHRPVLAATPHRRPTARDRSQETALDDSLASGQHCVQHPALRDALAGLRVIG